MKRWLAVVPLVVLAAFAALFLFRLKTEHSATYVPTATVGKPMPQAVLPKLADGTQTPLKAEVASAHLINFFASWCAPCIQEAPTLMALKAQGVRIVGVAWKDDPDKTKAMLQRVGDPYQTVLVDREGRTGIDFGVSGVPETYLIGADGKIIAKVAEPLTPASAERLLEQADDAR